MGRGELRRLKRIGYSAFENEFGAVVAAGVCSVGLYGMRVRVESLTQGRGSNGTRLVAAQARRYEDESVNGSLVAASLSEHLELHGERSGKKLEKVRNRAAAAVKGGRGGVSRNSSKDKGGKRSKASTREKIEY